MDIKNESIKYINSVKTLFMLSGKNIFEEKSADTAEENGKERIGYFISKYAEKKKIDIAIKGCTEFDKTYFVFGEKGKYKETKALIPKNIGIIFIGDLYGTGNIIKTIREPDRAPRPDL